MQSPCVHINTMNVESLYLVAFVLSALFSHLPSSLFHHHLPFTLSSPQLRDRGTKTTYSKYIISIQTIMMVIMMMMSPLYHYIIFKSMTILRITSLASIIRQYSYSTEHIEEEYLLHACKYIVKFLGNGDGDGSEEFQFEGEIKHFRLVVKEAEWLLVADVVTEEVYSRVIMGMLTENHDLEGLIESVPGGEVGLLEESFFSNLNDVGRLMGLDCAIYSELEKKYDDDAELIAFSVDEEGKDKDDTNSDAMMIKIKEENEAKMKLDEERVAHDDDGGDNGGDDGYLAALEEKKVSQVDVARAQYP